MLRQILHYPDRRLRQIAKPVTVFDENLAQLVNDMLETMYDAAGVGLAAIQIGVTQRVIVMDVSETRDQPWVLINPQIQCLGTREKMEEGCLSVPEMRETVQRHRQVKLRAFNANGEAYEETFEGLAAQCIQHEIEHLDGKLYIDQLSELKRARLEKKYQKMTLEK